ESERSAATREQAELRKAADGYHRSRMLRPYILGMFIVMMVAMALMLFRMVTLNDRLVEAETAYETVNRQIDNYLALQSQNTALESEIALLQNENEELRAAAEAPAPGTPGGTTAPPEEITLPTRYTVVQGDNLSRISQRFYGSPAHYRHIMDANGMTRDTVFIGQTLQIPEL
ncbi:MAG: LysM peptidoglycan-binding domain-containing protein, partial [Defluviitaleaceae bacterium]|nr:LysM peptidoglycan-binding domain-containing protein [Defluviitaleaceae bacterium]